MLTLWRSHRSLVRHKLSKRIQPSRVSQRLARAISTSTCITMMKHNSSKQQNDNLSNRKCRPSLLHCRARFSFPFLSSFARAFMGLSLTRSRRLCLMLVGSVARRPVPRRALPSWQSSSLSHISLRGNGKGGPAPRCGKICLRLLRHMRTCGMGTWLACCDRPRSERTGKAGRVVDDKRFSDHSISTCIYPRRMPLRC